MWTQVLNLSHASWATLDKFLSLSGFKGFYLYSWCYDDNIYATGLL